MYIYHLYGHDIEICMHISRYRWISVDAIMPVSVYLMVVSIPPFADLDIEYLYT